MNTNQDTTLTNQDAFEKWWRIKNSITSPSWLKQDAYEAWQAATKASEQRIQELEEELEVSNGVIGMTTKLLAEICLTLKGNPPDKTLFSYHDLQKMVTELTASNNKLREALEDYEEDWIRTGWGFNALTRDKAKQVLALTQAQSLEQHDNEVIEKCANACDEYLNTDYPECASDIKDAILALKVTP